MVILSDPVRQEALRNVVLAEKKLVKATCRNDTDSHGVASRGCTWLKPANVAAQPTVITPWIRAMADLATLLIGRQDSSIGDSTRLGALY
jgi:hypothetical protein